MHQRINISYTLCMWVESFEVQIRDSFPPWVFLAYQILDFLKYFPLGGFFRQKGIPDPNSNCLQKGGRDPSQHSSNGWVGNWCLSGRDVASLHGSWLSYHIHSHLSRRVFTGGKKNFLVQFWHESHNEEQLWKFNQLIFLLIQNPPKLRCNLKFILICIIIVSESTLIDNSHIYKQPLIISNTHSKATVWDFPTEIHWLPTLQAEISRPVYNQRVVYKWRVDTSVYRHSIDFGKPPAAEYLPPPIWKYSWVDSH